MVQKMILVMLVLMFPEFLELMLYKLMEVEVVVKVLLLVLNKHI
jgi:hypothetical protein